MTRWPTRHSKQGSRVAGDGGPHCFWCLRRAYATVFGPHCFTCALLMRNRRVTAPGDSPVMRRLAAMLSTLSLLACAGAAAGAGAPPQIPKIPGKWSHVELNVVIKRVPHTLIVDRGKIT